MTTATAVAAYLPDRTGVCNELAKRLSGEVEVDEAYVGGVEHGGRRGRGTCKCIVVIAVEVRHPKGFGRVRMRHVSDVSGASLLPFVCAAVTPGTVVLTDGWSGYNGLTKHGYERQKIVVSSSGDPAHVSLPGVHRVASLLKRWILGTHQGAVTANHLQSYLEEFTFRFNRRTSRSRGLVFRRLLEQAVAFLNNISLQTRRRIERGGGKAGYQHGDDDFAELQRNIQRSQKIRTAFDKRRDLFRQTKAIPSAGGQGLAVFHNRLAPLVKNRSNCRLVFCFPGGSACQHRAGLFIFYAHAQTRTAGQNDDNRQCAFK